MKPKNRRLPIALLTACFVLALASIPARSADSSVSAATGVAQATLTGVVTNSATGRPLTGARVEIQGQSRADITNSEGEYHFANIPSGNITL